MTKAEPKGGVSWGGKSSAAVDGLVLGTVNSPYKRNITASILEACLKNAELGDWPVHVASFFTEVRPNLVLGFAALHGISNIKLAHAYLAMKSETGQSNPELETELSRSTTTE
jgi:hypothetical protein